MLPSARLVGIEHAEDAAAGRWTESTNGLVRPGHRWLTTRVSYSSSSARGRVEHDLAHARAAVVGEVAMETFHPRFR